MLPDLGPEEAVVVGDLGESALLRGEQPFRVALELGSRVTAEGQDQHALGRTNRPASTRAQSAGTAVYVLPDPGGAVTRSPRLVAKDLVPDPGPQNLRMPLDGVSPAANWCTSSINVVTVGGTLGSDWATCLA